MTGTSFFYAFQLYLGFFYVDLSHCCHIHSPEQFGTNTVSIRVLFRIQTSFLLVDAGLRGIHGLWLHSGIFPVGFSDHEKGFV